MEPHRIKGVNCNQKMVMDNPKRMEWRVNWERKMGLKVKNLQFPKKPLNPS